jgi:hypothetical protein
MREMARARELLQELPRVPAPPEIEEAIHSHLERSVLLDDSSAASAPLRISRWPRIIAAAAIILLAAGLGIIVWLVIRPPSIPRTTAVNLPGPVPATAPSDVRMETADSLRSKPNFDETAKPKALSDSFAAPKTATSQPVGWGWPHREPMAAQAPPHDESFDQIGLVAVTSDPPQIQLQLRAFLSSQGLHAEAIDLPSQSLWPLDEPQKAFVVRGIDHEQVQSLRRLLDVSATTTLDRLNAPTTQPASDLSAASATQPAEAAPLPASQPVSESKVDLQILIRSQLPQPADQPPPQPTLEPTTRPDAPTTTPTFEDYQMP